MKPNLPQKKSSLAILATAILGVSLVPVASAGPLNAASGKYDGQISGSATAPIIGTERLQKTDAVLKLPTGKGRIVIRIEGFERAAGKVTKARVRQGGNKVVLTGRTQIPKSITGPIGAITGPFKAVVNLSGAKSTVRATTTLKKLGATAKGTFIGVQ